MKKIVNISIILLFAWQLIGVFIYFGVSTIRVKQEAQLVLSKNNKKKIQTLAFTTNEYKKIVWIDKKEFRYQSNFYDVKKIHRTNNKTFITCYLDTKENKLLQVQQDVFGLATSKNNDKNSQTILLKIIQTPFISNLEAVKISLLFPQELKEKQFFIYTTKNYLVSLDTSFKPPIQSV